MTACMRSQGVAAGSCGMDSTDVQLSSTIIIIIIIIAKHQDRLREGVPVHTPLRTSLLWVRCSVPNDFSNSNAAHTCERLHSDKSRATMDAMLHRQRLLVQRPSMLGLVQPRQATPLRRLPAYCRSCASLPTPPVPVTQIHAIDPEA